MTGRRKPYTEAGIKRVPCAHCDKPSAHQWTLRPCAGKRTHRVGLCTPCDLELNRLTLDFMRLAGREQLLAKYEARS